MITKRAMGSAFCPRRWDDALTPDGFLKPDGFLGATPSLNVGENARLQKQPILR